MVIFYHFQKKCERKLYIYFQGPDAGLRRLLNRQRHLPDADKVSQINHFIEALNREMGVTVEEAEEDEGSSVQLETIVSPGKIVLATIGMVTYSVFHG